MNTDHYFQIHGITVKIQGEHPDILQEIDQELCFFKCGPVTSPRICIKFIQMNDLNEKNLSRVRPHQDPNDEINWIREDIASVLNIPNRTVNLYMTGSCPEDAVVVILFGITGFLVSLELSLNEKLAAFHGASLYKDGKGILLLGKTNSGKTSLSCLMTGHGFSYLSEEDSFIHMKGEDDFQILPYPRRIRISKQVIKQHPQFSRMAHPKKFVESLDEHLFRIDPRESLPSSAPLKTVIFLDNDKDHTTVSVEPLHRSEAFFFLLSSLEIASIQGSPETAWQDLKNRNRSAYQVSHSIVDSMVITRVKYNIIRDFPTLPGIISDLSEAE
jgi:hypothetical protein